jgi:hypothetical protein
MKCLVVVLLLGFCAAIAGGQAPIVRTQLQPAGGILVGQPVRLIVSVFVPNYFTGSPEFPEFEMENAIVVLPQDRPQNTNERIGGVTYAGITETYTIYAQQPGDFQLPAAMITVPYASSPPKSTIARVPLPSVAFHADLPAAARNLDYFLPTTQLTMQQKWSSPLTNLRAGDSIERTITVTAIKMQGMLIPPLPFVGANGLRVYPDEPAVEDHKTDRGEFVYGRRTQSAKYFIQKEGDYTLPAVELKWWNLSTDRLTVATLPAVHFTAAPNANYEAELPPEPETITAAPVKRISLWIRYRIWIRVVLPCCTALLFVLWLSWRYVPSIYRKLQTWRQERQHSETAYFRNLQRSCRQNHAAPAYAWLLKWLALAYPNLPVHEFLLRADDPALLSETNDLGASLFAKSNRVTQWKGRELATLLRQHRKARATCATKDMLKLNP